MLAASLMAATGVALASLSTLQPDHGPQPAPGPAPQGMVWVPGGSSQMGSNLGADNEAPVHAIQVQGFWLGRSPVTVAAFARFIAASGYVTTAEKHGSGEVMQFGTGHWRLIKGATWRTPFGPGSQAIATHPVTQVSWYDAHAYCQSQARRLPSEAEWEYAARYGHAPYDIYHFQAAQQGHYHANVWTGRFPGINTAADGYTGTSPVGAFGAGPLGLTDMLGNVWEWSASWYRPYGSHAAGWQPDAPAQKALRGGSFLCDANVCNGYRVTARAHATADSALMQVGFRCADDAKAHRQLAATLPYTQAQLEPTLSSR